jgi:hypothetical protein
MACTSGALRNTSIIRPTTSCKTVFTTPPSSFKFAKDLRPAGKMLAIGAFEPQSWQNWYSLRAEIRCNQ